MEFWARWAHRALWHASLWDMHESHHLPRDGPFELNDVFAIVNAVPAMALLAFGFFNRGLLPGLCFGAVSTTAPSPSSIYLLRSKKKTNDCQQHFVVSRCDRDGGMSSAAPMRGTHPPRCRWRISYT
uniref:beta-carotene 3-hydroxylase n=1 Tax=Aegilops tauschii subsp. strangulata TaxID=200361 RepID=A0A453J0R5_AEGTS